MKTFILKKGNREIAGSIPARYGELVTVTSGIKYFLLTNIFNVLNYDQHLNNR